MIGETIGSYTILRRLGEGGMGEVYLAEHRHIARRAAIKLLLPEFTTKTDVVSRFFTEARATSLIRHPGIVEILDCAVHTTGRAYIIMEFLEGESLAATLERVGSLSSQPKSALAILGQIASALAAAHGKGIIHRDLKPDNIFLASFSGESGLRVKILDFGIAKLAAEGQASLQRTRTGSLLGTPVYMSPEQCRGAGAVDLRTDIYSLGCIAYELFAGHPPFVKEGAGELLVAHMAEQPRPLSEESRGVTPELEDLVSRLLAKDPNKRPSTALEVVQAIEGLLRVRASEFASLIETPDGFPKTNGTSPSRLAVSDENHALGNAGTSQPVVVGAPSGTNPGYGGALSGGGTVVAEPVIGGGTRLLPVVDGPLPGQQAREPKTQTTFSRTASESIVTQNTRRSPSKKLWLAGAAALVVGVGALALWPKGAKENADGDVPPLADNTSDKQGDKVGDNQPTDKPRPGDKTLPAGSGTADNGEQLPAVFELSSEPAGAEVWLPDEASARGVTPFKLAVPKGAGRQTVILKATGFEDKEVALEPGREGALAVVLEAKPTQGGGNDRAGRLGKNDLSKTETGKPNDDGPDKERPGISEPVAKKGKSGKGKGKVKDDPYKAMGD